MSESKTFTCPSCGAALTTTGDADELKCSFCGSTVIVPPELHRPRDSDDDSDDGPDSELADVAAPNLKPLMTFVTGIVGVSVIAPLVITVVTLVLVGVVMLVVFGFVVPLATGASRPSASNSSAVTATHAAALASATATPTRTPAPTSTATPTPAFAKVLLQDNFGDPASGWERGTTDRNTADYTPGGYHILLGKDQSNKPGWVKDAIGDSSITVNSQKTGGPLDTWMGVLCPVRKDVGGYAFEFTTTGRYQIVKYRYSAQGSSASPLERGELSVPPKSDGPNQLRADCIGSSLVLWINGRLVTNFKDSEFTTGGVGLIAETDASGKSGGDILFSNYLVKGP